MCVWHIIAAATCAQEFLKFFPMLGARVKNTHTGLAQPRTHMRRSFLDRKRFWKNLCIGDDAQESQQCRPRQSNWFRSSENSRPPVASSLMLRRICIHREDEQIHVDKFHREAMATSSSRSANRRRGFSTCLPRLRGRGNIENFSATGRVAVRRRFSSISLERNCDGDTPDACATFSSCAAVRSSMFTVTFTT